MTNPIVALQADIKKLREDSVRLVYADVTTDSPLTVTYDDGDTEQLAYALAETTPSTGDRVAVLRSGNSPGLVFGVMA